MLVHDYLDFFAREQPDAICMSLEQRQLSYRQVQEQSRQLANAMIASGLQHGDRFAVLTKNSMETVLAYMAGSISGLVPVPLNWRLASPEWQYIANDAGVKLIIAEQEFSCGIDSVREQLPEVRVFVSVGENEQSDWFKFDDFCAAQRCTNPDVRVTEQDVFY